MTAPGNSPGVIEDHPCVVFRVFGHPISISREMTRQLTRISMMTVNLPFKKTASRALLLCSAILLNAGLAQSRDSGNVGFARFVFPLPVDSFYVIVNGDYEHFQKMRSTTSLSLPEGIVALTVVTEKYEDSQFNIEIAGGATIDVPVSFVIPDKAGSALFNSSYTWITRRVNVEIRTDDDSKIWINDRLAAKGTRQLDIPDGPCKIETRHPSGARTKKNISVTSREFKAVEMYNKPLRSHALIYSLVPGASQLYKKQTVKGIVSAGLLTAAAALSIQYYLAFRDDNSEYAFYRSRYERENTNLAVSYGDLVQKYFDSAESNAKKRDTFLMITLGVYAVNLLDGLISRPEAGYRSNRDLETANRVRVKASPGMCGINVQIGL
jgi:hypothetical protein